MKVMKRKGKPTGDEWICIMEEEMEEPRQEEDDLIPILSVTNAFDRVCPVRSDVRACVHFAQVDINR